MRKLIGMLCGSLLLVGAMAAELEVLRGQDGKPERYAGRVAPGEVRIPTRYQAPARELRGVWIATVENIDFPTHGDAASFTQDFRAMMQVLAQRKFNAVFVQIRANNDAFYPSRLNPWSRWLTGAEGRSIAGLDPLKTMIAEAKKQRLEFHAWLNPYRVIGKTKLSKSAYLATLAPTNFARRNPQYVLEAPLKNGERLLFLNPGEPAVVNHIRETVAEILRNYAVDAIHFDDYFYPYSSFGNIDAATFARRNPGKLSLAEWRRNNVDTLIAGVRREIDEHNRRTGRRVQFGISPFGIWANRRELASGSLSAGKSSYLAQYADTRGWVKKGYLDYIVPQLYWPFGHDVAAYAALTDWWAAQVRGTRTRLYIGMAPYRMGESQWKNPREIANQLRYNTKHPEISGEIFFSARSVLRPSNPLMRNALNIIYREYWTRPAVLPSR